MINEQSELAVVENLAKTLKLSTVAAQAGPLSREAQAQGASYLRYLAAVLEQELLHREEASLKRRLKAACFPVTKTLDSFDFSAVPSLSKTQVLGLARGEFIRRKENIILMGSTGVGKTHLAIGLATAACRQGYRVRFFAVPELVNELRAAYQENRLNRFIRQWLKYDLVVQDELGYVPFDQLSAQLLFQVLAARYERGSIIITTNLEFGQWAELFGDERLTAALIDRLTHRAHILVLNGESYRFRESLRRQGAKDASSVTG
ncbi:IS21-like element helper ATPase IstB [Desulfofundulus thermosubterraneus]|uniref:DNA replication protein DnaC n=1 Tax=Desulfofundulus thermosubterraneus DSM 16057 TaxID=1121432 RepID=A0A1M6MYT9_9FIRM|nr:IS21-like element helper ATPase IstB [Desulfofundulus thermosubterraneus]SHJ88596.1 DNA replication protein DnaC [Desulfofundulus thermosubterraneus DSM 16057]